MSSILKETENPAATPSAAAPAAKPSVDEQKSTQPVALEIPVTVNGARTVEGSDKREPFSETTKTVLVFGHGAVVRISSSLAPGQLIFLTNEKTKKEVVCQVVKSKNQGPSNGYVELQFTEAAPGYWGMRFPAGNSNSPAAVPSRPVAPASAKPVSAAPTVVSPSASPAVLPAPSSSAPTPIVVTASPAAPAKKEIVEEQETVALHPALPETPAVIEVANTVQTPSVEVSVEKIPSANIGSAASISVEVPAQAVASVSVPKISVPENPSLDDLAKQLTKELLQGSPQESVPESKASEIIAAEPKETPKETPQEPVNEVPVNVSEPAAKTPALASNEPTTEELKQKAVQLQAKLSSLLFADSGKTPDSSNALSESPLQTTPNVAQPEATPALPLISKPSSLLQKPLVQSLAVEEVKIPSWLAPLARESDFRSGEQTAETGKSESVSESVNAKDDVEISDMASEDAPRKQQATMFGGQLITDASDVPQVSGSSKKGLWIGIAAAALLLASGAWYANQPDNLLSGIFGSKPVPAHKSSAVETNDPNSTPFRNEVSQPAETGRTSPAVTNNASSNSNIAAPIPNTNSKNSAAPVSFPASKNSAAVPVSAPSKALPVPEEPKKPVFGDVHLATPSVKRSDASTDTSDSEPAIENNPSVASPDALNSLAGAHHSGPAIPLPIGGEVKQARLLKTVPPVYPPTAKTQHVSGDVKLDALIDANGKVTSTKVISGPVLLHQAAAEAVKQWQYDPAQLNGKATSMHLTVTVQFRLQ